eukprot:gene8168-10043_t
MIAVKLSVGLVSQTARYFARPAQLIVQIVIYAHNTHEYLHIWFIYGSPRATLHSSMMKRAGMGNGADGGGRTRMTYGRGILSPLRLPVSPRPRAYAFQRFGRFRQQPFAGKSGLDHVPTPMVQ